MTTKTAAVEEKVGPKIKTALPGPNAKRILAKDLIGDDDGFVKSLSRADVEYLFS